MNIKLTKMTKIVGAVVAVSFFGVGAYVGVTYITEPSVFKVVADGFEPGTQIAYQVFSEGKYLDEGKKIVGDDRSVSLDIDNQIPKDKKLTYKIDLEKKHIDKIMEVSNPMSVMLDIDQAQKSVSFSGAGFPEFSDVFVSADNKTKASKTDWVGNFNEKAGIPDSLMPKVDNMVKLAFQNINLGKDVDLTNPNSVKVFFGDKTGTNLAKVHERWARSIEMMTHQLSIVMMQQVYIIGTLLDAKMQVETQRKFQELQARAHKDYHPSELMCRFGTFVKSVAKTEAKAENDKRVLNRYLMDQYLGTANSSSALGQGISIAARVKKFSTTYCDPYDNNGGLKLLCDTLLTPSKEQMERFNKDIDYIRTVDNKLTIDVDFSDSDLTKEEEDILALAQNLYFPQVFEKPDNKVVLTDPRGHYNSRTFAAKMNVAHDSFVTIVGMKANSAKAPSSKNPPPKPALPVLDPRDNVPPLPNYTEDGGWTYMKAMLRDYGIVNDKNANGTTDDEIHGWLGAHPSYYAQMEVLTKMIFQYPDFYTNLYDKPANVDRIGVSIDAISLMNMRDRYESLQRREMLTSILVEEALMPQVADVNARILSSMQEPPPRTK